MTGRFFCMLKFYTSARGKKKNYIGEIPLEFKNNFIKLGFNTVRIGELIKIIYWLSKLSILELLDIYQKKNILEILSEF